MSTVHQIQALFSKPYKEWFNRLILTFFTYSFIFVLFTFSTKVTVAQDSLDVFGFEDFDVWESAESTLSIHDFENPQKLAYPNDQMRFSNIDDPKWRLPEINDYGLSVINTLLRPSDMAFIEWRGIGWFRLEINVDASLTGQELALIPETHFGASEVYLNGELIGGYGVINTNPDSCVYTQAGRPILLYFSRPGRHILAIRYANFEAESLNKQGIIPGFRFRIGDFKIHLDNWLSQKTQVGTANLFILGALIAVTLVHLLLFIFYPLQKNNFYFALFTGSLSLLSLSEYMVTYITDPFLFLIWFKLTDLFLVLSLLMALRFSYELFYAKKPTHYYVLCLISAGLIFYYAQVPYPNALPLDLFVLVVVAELIRGLIRARNKNKEGYWIIGAGLSSFMIGLILSVFDDFSIVQAYGSLAKSGGTGLLIASLSIFLSRNVAGANKRLRSNIRQIRQLARQNMEQEMLTRQKELQRKILAAENYRKSEELSKARSLQLSMLPSSLPEIAELDIAVHMETAYEVGGDYYDFADPQNEYITGVIGDATGHGMSSGIVVATVKSHFKNLCSLESLEEILTKISLGVRHMGLKTTFMGLIIYRYYPKNGRFLYASAGMPPILLSSNSSNELHTCLTRSFPAGAPRSFNYHEQEIMLKKGDSLLMMSDGLMELFDEKRNMLGLKKVEEEFFELRHASAANIIEGLKKLATDWLPNKKPNDDITFVCLKRKA